MNIDEKVLAIKGAIAGSIALLVNYLGGWDDMLWVLAVMVVLDYLGGVSEAILTRTLSSAVGARGIFKKTGYVAAVIMGNMLDVIAGLDVALFRSIIILFLIANESLSLIEHLVAIGVPIPKFVVVWLAKLRDEVDSGNLPKHEDGSLPRGG